MRMLRYILFGSVALLAPVAAFAAEGEKKGMPQLDISTFPSQLFWLAVFFVLFYSFMRLVAMPRLHQILEARESRIADDLGHATSDSETAHRLKNELEVQLGKARDQARALIADANDKIRSEASARDAALSTELTGRIERAEAAINAARAQAMSSIEDIATGMVQQILPRIANITTDEGDARRAVAAGARS